MPPKRRSSAPSITHLTPEQQEILAPELERLGKLTNLAIFASCCTLCISWIPYALKARQVVRQIDQMDEDNRQRTASAPPSSVADPVAVNLDDEDSESPRVDSQQETAR